MKYMMLASGSKGNACIIQSEGINILIDCGTTKKYLKQSFEAVAMTFEDIDVVLVTHHHSDHTSQLKHFAHAEIYSPTPNNEYQTVTPYEAFSLGYNTCLPIKTSHDDEYSVGYVISSTSKRLVYITDTGYIKESDEDLLKGANYYILESNHDPEMLMQTQRPYSIKRRILSDSGHLSNEEAGNFLAKVTTGKTESVLLAHLSQQANDATLALKTVQNIVQNKEIEFKAAKQFEIIIGGTVK